MLLIYRNITKHHIHAFNIYLLMLHAFNHSYSAIIRGLSEIIGGGGALPLFVYFNYNTPLLMLCMYTKYCANPPPPPPPQQTCLSRTVIKLNTLDQGK